ncbi:LINE-1 retrotransposable element ORF2 protein [Elysia marginata]|uniref:LINE-1 retrotransposable element ORF2 protein n=1 Tax=Elysia marginata TaxID=1093978 RepID=A0AAV4HS32_9GAST|nr:LINE-1 retrotransposable element ORF2 protein [Elysia marginata]
MNKEGKKLWILTQALNDDNPKTDNNTAIICNGVAKSGKRAADVLAKQYKSISTIDTNRAQEVKEKMKEIKKPASHIDVMEERITPQELRKNIKGLKKKKSPGPDGILTDMIKHLGPHALSTLLDLFNNSWRTICDPQVWKEAHIIPIHIKGKSKTDPISYRPISPISCVGKLLEKIINKRLMYHLETNGIISPTQSGFRKNTITPYVKHTLHADDFAIWSTAEYATTAKVRVQATVDRVFKWSQDWGLTINLNKTVINFH